MAEPIQEGFADRLDRLTRTHGPESTALESEPDEDTPRRPAKVVSLPQWVEAKRGVPNAALRLALFAAIQGPKHRALERELLATSEGLEIRFTGWQLNQSDLDVWEQVLHLARQPPLGTRSWFVAYDLLKTLGRSTGRANHEWLKGAISRLMAAGVEITQGQWTYGGTLLDFYRDEETNRYVLDLNPKLLDLFNAGWTAIDWAQRQQLRRQPLALWLHGYLASHAEPFPVTVAYLHRLSGSNTKSMKHFKANLIVALKELEGIGAIQSFGIIDHLVHVETIPSPSQQQYLNQSKSRKNEARYESDRENPKWRADVRQTKTQIMRRLTLQIVDTRHHAPRTLTPENRSSRRPAKKTNANCCFFFCHKNCNTLSCIGSH